VRGAGAQVAEKIAAKGAKKAVGNGAVVINLSAATQVSGFVRFKLRMA
jgi:hypothetical protein